MHSSRKWAMVYLKTLPQTSPVQTWENSHRGNSHAWQQKKGHGILEDIIPDFTSADLRKQNEEAEPLTQLTLKLKYLSCTQILNVTATPTCSVLNHKSNMLINKNFVQRVNDIYLISHESQYMLICLSFSNLFQWAGQSVLISNQMCWRLVQCWRYTFLVQQFSIIFSCSFKPENQDTLHIYNGIARLYYYFTTL